MKTGQVLDDPLKKEASIPVLLDTSFKKVDLDENFKLFISLVLSFLKPNDQIIDFNEDGCVTSCFFNDVIVHEGGSNHTVFLPIDDKYTRACSYNIQSTSSKINLEFLTKETVRKYTRATVLILESLSPSFQDAFLDLCSTLDTLRLVIFNTDTESTELLQKVNTLLTIKNFYPHVVGKYTVYVKDVKPEKVTKLKKTPQSSHVLLAIFFIFFSICACFALKEYFWG